MPCDRFRLPTILFFALLLLCPAASAQIASARLEGVVRDPSDAFVIGARVSMLNARTQARTETSVTSGGLFVFPSLYPGQYTLSIEAAGFRKAVVPDLELNVGVTTVQNFKLEFGALTEQIVVQAGRERVQASDSQITNIVTVRDIAALPQLGRNPMTLALLGAGVQINTKDPTLSHVNGTREGSTDARLDGIDVSDNSGPRFLWTTLAQNEDSIEESHIVTSGGKAEFGRNAGGQIQLITRSGTSIWHGNAFDYHRNTVLNANTFFGNSSGLDRPVYIQNTFGASLGGPIRRDRTFVFGNYQGRRTAQQVIRNRLVLTRDAKAGLFRWRPPGSPEIHEFNIVSSDPRGLGIDPQIAGILELLPDPNNYDIGDGLNTAGYRFNNPANVYVDDIGHDQFTIRADHKLRSGHQLFFRWTWDQSSFIDALPPNFNDARFPGQPAATQNFVKWGYSIGWNWAITPHLVSELRAGHTSYTNDLLRPTRLKGPMLLANSWTDPLNPAFAQRFVPSMSQITDNLSVVRGRHIFKGGVEGRFTRDSRSNDDGTWPNVTFTNALGNAPPETLGPGENDISPADRQVFEELYNDLLGRMFVVTQSFFSDLISFQPAGTSRVRVYRYNEFSGFFQDDWRLHPRLVLNLGLRYEFFGVPFETDGLQGYVDKAPLISSTAQIKDLTILKGGRLYNNDFNNFAPRVGLAWDPEGDGKMAIRANWGVFYDRIPGRVINNVGGNTPGFTMQRSQIINSSTSGTDIRVSDGIPELHPPAIPQPRPPVTHSTNLALFNPGFRTGYVQHYSLTIQREILRNTVVEAGYVGTHGTKLFMGLNLNQPRIYEDFLAAFLELQAYHINGTPVSASNTLVRIFGTPQKAIESIGATDIEQGAAGKVADSLDRFGYPYYKSAGVSDFYLRNFPQFNRVMHGTNDGRSYYNAFQVSLRRQTGALKFAANYTFSRSIDSISVDTFTSPIDSFNVRLNRGRSDYDLPHAFKLSLDYTLPLGNGRRFAADSPSWLKAIIGGWDVGLLILWQSGNAFTCFAGIATGPSTDSSFCNYSGDRNIGKVMRKSDGVYWLTDEEIERFSFPAAGDIGTSGRNAFRGPRYFSVDVSLRKKFKIRERHALFFRAEAYNLFNNVNFDIPNADLSYRDTFGRISSAVPNPRVLQMALRYDF